MSSSVTHFEIYAEDPAKLADFYRGLFGWQVDQAPGIEYWRIQPGATEPQGVGGGLTYRPMPGLRCWVHYVNVPSIDEALTQAELLGGVVLRPKTAVPQTALVCDGGGPGGQHIRHLAGRPDRVPTAGKILIAVT